jgi:AraC family transcriptional regulator
MNRVALLLRTPAVALWSFDHPPTALHEDPEYEVASQESISFVEEGSFEVRVGGKHWRLAPDTLFVATRGMRFSCKHDCDTPTDRCLSVTYDEQTVEDLRAADVPALRPPLAHSSARQRYLGRRLRSCGPGHELRLELLAGALFESLTRSGASPPVGVEGRASPLVPWIDRAVELIEAEFGRPLTLRELAGAAGLSTFHFARAFRELTGLPPHRYLMAVRLSHAAALLEQGAGVTYTCFEVGFGSLSHFITAFRQRFGIIPSDVRRGVRYPALRSSLRAPLRKRRHR